MLDLQRTAGNAAANRVVHRQREQDAAGHSGRDIVQRHAAPGIRNTFREGGLSDVVLTPQNPEDGPYRAGALSFVSGHMSGLTEHGAPSPGLPHFPPGLFNTFTQGGLSGVIFTDSDGSTTPGNLSFRSGRLHDLIELSLPSVQRHAAPGLGNRFGAGGLSDVVFTPEGGGSFIAHLSFQSGRFHGLTETDGSKPKPKPAPKQRLLSRARRSRGEDVKVVQARLNTFGETLAVDGIFGRLTDGAVRRFQFATGCKVDGIVGSETRNALGI